MKRVGIFRIHFASCCEVLAQHRESFQDAHYLPNFLCKKQARSPWWPWLVCKSSSLRLWKDDVFFSLIFAPTSRRLHIFTSHQENMMVCTVYLQFWDTSEVTTCHNHRYFNFHFVRFIGSPIQCRRCLSSSNFRRISGGGWGLEYSLGVSLPQRLGACLVDILCPPCLTLVVLVLSWSIWGDILTTVYLRNGASYLCFQQLLRLSVFNATIVSLH